MTLSQALNIDLHSNGTVTPVNKNRLVQLDIHHSGYYAVLDEFLQLTTGVLGAFLSGILFLKERPRLWIVDGQ